MAEDRRQPEQLPILGGRRRDDPPAEWVSVSDYARIYGLSRPTVYKLIDADLLVVYRVQGLVNLVRVRNLPPKDSAATV